MLSAKLFAALAVLQLGLSLLASKMSQGGVDLYLHGTYLGFTIESSGHVQIHTPWILVMLCPVLFVDRHDVECLCPLVQDPNTGSKNERKNCNSDLH
jgi:hypothetical protein